MLLLLDIPENNLILLIIKHKYSTQYLYYLQWPLSCSYIDTQFIEQSPRTTSDVAKSTESAATKFDTFQSR